jgi:glycine/D-amino acid oxidase-like deaminating enzyme
VRDLVDRAHRRRVRREVQRRLLGALGALEARVEGDDPRELELVAVRAGLRPATPDNAPVVGRGELEGLMWATGHGRNGVLQAPATARRITGALRELARVAG